MSPTHVFGGANSGELCVGGGGLKGIERWREERGGGGPDERPNANDGVPCGRQGGLPAATNRHLPIVSDCKRPATRVPRNNSAPASWGGWGGGHPPLPQPLRPTRPPALELCSPSFVHRQSPPTTATRNRATAPHQHPPGGATPRVLGRQLPLPPPPPPPGAFGQQLVAKGVALRPPWAPKAPDAP